MDQRLEYARRGRAYGIVIAAPASGTGKTVLTMGLSAALRGCGLKVAIAKAGPDYIDTGFLAAAASGPCLNLDAWAMEQGELRARANSHSADTDLLIVEGVMGLFDGAAGGGGSTADLAHALGLPVVLVVDASRQAQSIAATVHGFATFHPHLKVSGVIATQVASDRHAEMVRDALGRLDVAYLGAFRRTAGLALRSRHLGLVQAREVHALQDVITAARTNAETHLDLNGLLRLAKPLHTLDCGSANRITMQRFPPIGQRIAVAKDVAFGFLYVHVLDDWQQQGAEISCFSPLDDEAPDLQCDAVFLPGGYPEIYAGKLAAASRFLGGLRQAAARGSAIYGECGGYMVLGQALIDAHATAHPMAGLLGHVTSFAERKRNLGYRQLENAGHTERLPRRLNGHEFHYSTVAQAGHDLPLFHGRDSSGHETGDLGGCRGAVMGSYAHIINICQERDDS